MPTNKKKKGKKAKGKAKKISATVAVSAALSSARLCEEPQISYQDLLEIIRNLSKSSRSTVETEPPEDATCWICLESGADEEGNPLRRGCCCRNESGFAHISCLGTFAQKKYQKVMKAHERNESINLDMDACRDPWTLCFNCKQPYKMYVAVDMALKYIEILGPRNSVVSREDLLAFEITFANLNLLEALTSAKAVDESKELFKHVSRFLTFGREGGENSMLTELGEMTYRAEACTTLGYALTGLENTRADFEKGGELLEKALALRRELGDTKNVEAIKRSLKCFDFGERIYRGTKKITDHKSWAKEMIPEYESKYYESIRLNGSTSRATLAFASRLASFYAIIDKPFKAYDLVKKSIPVARRVLGAKDEITQGLDEEGNFRLCREWPGVFVMGEFAGITIDIDDALRGAYSFSSSNTGTSISLIDNVEYLEASNEYRLIKQSCGVSTTCHPSRVIMFPRTPVTLVELENTVSLNGKRGVITAWNTERQRYHVYLEDTDESVLVKTRNARVHFFERL